MKKYSIVFILYLMTLNIYASNGVSRFNYNGTSFSYANLGTTRANDETNTKKIMTTYQNESSLSFFNNFPDAENDTTSYPNDLGTHYLYSTEDYHYTKSTSNTLESLTDGKPLGNRTPILLVHGWQGDKGTINPLSQIENVDSPEEYWHNLIDFFTNYHDLKNKYKIYVYKYPSYKHVSFNGQILKHMLSDENIIPELKEKKIIFISHSMGTLIVRSAFEEHKLPISKAEKIFFLAGVHHGSPASIPNLVSSNTLVKELYTLGANDIQWDNYDKLFTSETRIGTSKKIVKEEIFKLFIKRFDNVNNWSYIKVNREELEQKGYTLKPKLETYSQPTIEPLRLNFYGSNTNKISPIRIKETYYFDEFFRKKILDDKYIYLQGIALKLTNISSEPIIFPLLKWEKTDNYEHAVIPLTINPWLTYLNNIYKTMSNAYKKKILFYAGVNSNGTFIKNNKLTDTWDMGLAEDGVSHLGELTCVSDCYGYLNDGPVPMTSALLLDSKYSFDKLAEDDSTSQVRVYTSWINSDVASVKYYSNLDSEYIGNGQSKHVLFMDYHHNRMKSGGYDKTDSSLSYKTGFKSLDNRKLYIKNASKNQIIPNGYELYSTDLMTGFKWLNTIKYEPLFLSIAFELNAIPSNPSNDIPYSDVKIDDWFYDYVKDLFDRGTLTDKIKFLPGTSITKAEFLKIACELNGFQKVYYKLNFDDVGKDDWFYDYVMFASSKGWIDIKKISFNPNKKISRAEASQIIVNILKIDKCTSSINFSDVSENDWYFNSICILNEKKIVKGYDNNTFEPNIEINRASASKILSLAFPKDNK